MPSVNEKIADEIRRHSVMLARYTEGQKTMIFRRVNSIFKKLKEQTADAEIFTGTVKQRKRAIDALFQRAEKEISQAYESIGKQVDLNLYDLAEVETGWTRKLLASNLKVSMGKIATVSKEQLNSLMSEVLIEGAPSAEWWSRQSVKLTDHFKDGIRQGWARGESIDNILKRLTGGADENGDPIFDIRKGTLRGAEATIRTSVQAISNDARRQVYKANADILQGVQWVSTLDTRTTIECASLDGLMWDMDDQPIDHDMVLIQPPRHWNCRSVLVPVTKSFEELGFKEYDDFGEGERSSIDGQVPASKTFDKWLSEKPQSYAEEVFGVERAKLWSEGRISVRDMVNQQGNPLTLAELKAKIAESAPYAAETTALKTLVADIVPDNEFMQEFEEKEQQAYKRAMEKGEKYVKAQLQLEKMYQESLDDLLPTEKTSVVIRAHFGNVEKILDSGRFKNQFETGSSGGMLDNQYRQGFEKRFFGTPTDAPKDMRPIYGMLMDAGTESGGRYRTSRGYGSVVFVLKQKIKQHATVTLDDSLSAGSYTSMIPSPVLKPSYKSAQISHRFGDFPYGGIGSSGDTIQKIMDADSYGVYAEVQIHRTRVTMKDVQKVVFDERPTPSIIKKLEDLGIPWE